MKSVPFEPLDPGLYGEESSVERSPRDSRLG